MVAIPMPFDYPLPESTKQVIMESGALLIDARVLEGIEKSNFPDNYHLDAAGAKILTTHILETLQPLWWAEKQNGD